MPTSVPSGILVYPAVWSQQTWAENWGAVLPFGGSWVPIYYSVAWAKAHLHTKWHLDPSSRLATTDMGHKVGATVPPFWEGELAYLHANFILIHPTVWPQYTNVTDRTDRQTTVP